MTEADQKEFATAHPKAAVAAEAWVPVILQPRDEWVLQGMLQPFAGRPAVLVYPNSD